MAQTARSHTQDDSGRIGQMRCVRITHRSHGNNKKMVPHSVMLEMLRTTVREERQPVIVQPELHGDEQQGKA